MLRGELTFTTARSSGPGGQNVNKVNSKVTLHFNIVDSEVLSYHEKAIILKKRRSKLTMDGVLMLSSQDSRSQRDNKQAVLEKLDLFLKEALKEKKSRKPSTRSKSSVKKRLDSKKSHSDKKKLRQKLKP